MRVSCELFNTSAEGDSGPGDFGEGLEDRRPLGIGQGHRCDPVKVLGDIMVGEVDGALSLRSEFTNLTAASFTPARLQVNLPQG